MNYRKILVPMLCALLAVTSLTACKDNKTDGTAENNIKQEVIDPNKPIDFKGECIEGWLYSQNIKPANPEGFLIGELNKVTDLTFVCYGFTQDDIDDLKYFSNLKTLRINARYYSTSVGSSSVTVASSEDMEKARSAVKNLDVLKELKSLENLEMEFVVNDIDMSILNELPQLSKLKMDYCDVNMTGFKNPATRWISLDNCADTKLKDLYPQMELATADAPMTVLYKLNTFMQSTEQTEWSGEWTLAREKFSKEVIKRNE